MGIFANSCSFNIGTVRNVTSCGSVGFTGSGEARNKIELFGPNCYPSLAALSIRTLQSVLDEAPETLKSVRKLSWPHWPVSFLQSYVTMEGQVSRDKEKYT